ncbi:DEAD/DEAH box helicase [Mycoplasma crocodyli]|uniref:Putative ATP-dependent helicase n=1 Tax=Mycoplasma crocodyli (strain ATCC 51981 / MP145) TaxID=512564 RepID=D5E5R0_MYCCM|nr:AAA domain-containing protein [Mycoplasma crocodyli]ADE19748.1 putative ATP-dependent helicase [Mycoplasma crocodyli MP145]
MKTIDERYKAILDNLLEVTSNDPSIFTTINNRHFFDVYKLFNPTHFETIYKNKVFEIPIIETSLLKLVGLVEKAETKEELENLLKENEYIISDYNARMLNNNFAETKTKIRESINASFQKSTIKWKLLLSKANEINDEINIWPLHLSFMYVSLVLDDNKVIYAPLFFKEVFIKFRNGIPNLISNGEIHLNEKLIFILNNQGFNFSIDFDISNYSIDELVKKLSVEWNTYYPEILNNIGSVFDKKTNETILNQSLQFHTGIVLGTFLPAGGYSRNRMKEIIDNDEIDDIISVDFNKNTYKNKVKNSIFSKDLALFKITPTNYSQDKAIISSLCQNTIIWGPPGTGKSQTIVNILTNVLVYGKSAIVASQKKAALEVIRNRLGSLSCFGLFILTSKDMKKRSFFAPIKQYLDFLENYDNEVKIDYLKIITDKEKLWVDTLVEIQNNEKANEIIQAYFYLYNNIDKLEDEQIKFILSLPKNIIYPETNIEKRMDKVLIKINKVFPLPFLKRYKSIKLLGVEINKNLNDFKANLAELVRAFRNLDTYDIEWLNKIFDLMPNYDLASISNEEMIKNIAASRIINKIKVFDKAMTRRYREFASSVRIGNLEPYKFVKEYADMIKVLFPIIIATPDTDLSKWNKNEFDFGIMDESSQIFIEKGLPILYLSNIKILAGDDKQMKPSNWFGTRSTDDSIFGNVESLLDYATSLGVYNILLDKNYRSNYASLMTFSSKYFYNSSLDVIDIATAIKDSAIEVIQVDGEWLDNKNIKEAKKALELCNGYIDKYKKIILLAFNAKQREYLTDLIYEAYPKLEAAINERRLMLRNIENIQGDEADLVICTIAYDKNSKINSTYVGRSGGMNALNVAISRAKDKMIVIKTIKSEDVSNLTNSEDTKIFKEWLKFLELDENQRKTISVVNANYNEEDELKIIKNHSELEQNLLDYLDNIIKLNPSIKYIKDYTIGTLNIDIATFIDDKIYKCFIFDEFEYENDYEAFVILKDKLNFLRSKKYDMIILNSINWLRDKNKIDEHYSQESIDMFKEQYNQMIENEKIDLLNYKHTKEVELKDENQDANEEFDDDINNNQIVTKEQFIKELTKEINIIEALEGDIQNETE